MIFMVLKLALGTGYGNPALDGRSGCRGWGAQVDAHFGGAHTAKEITIVGGQDFLPVTEDASGTSAAQTAARVGDDASRFRQRSDGTGFDCLYIDLAAGRCDDGLDCSLFAFKDGSGCFKIFQTAVGT